jgi:cysteinyl-tRNA synthetase
MKHKKKKNMIRNHQGIQIRLNLQQHFIKYYKSDTTTTTTTYLSDTTIKQNVRRIPTVYKIQSFHVYKNTFYRVRSNITTTTTTTTKYKNSCHTAQEFSRYCYHTNPSLQHSSSSSSSIIHDDSFHTSNDLQNRKGHDYTQVTDSSGNTTNISTLNDMEIHVHLTNRLRCVYAKDFVGLHTIDTILEQANVYVNDTTQQWRADGHNFTSSTTTKSSTKSSSTTTTTDKHSNDSNQQQQQQEYIDARHDYRLSPYSGPNNASISEIEIHNLLSERHYYRKVRDFHKADMIRKQLESHGVFIDDYSKKWRGDGTKFVQFTHTYKCSRDSGPITAKMNEHEIHDLLSKRHRCRLRKDFKGADTILEKLTKNGVSIDDELQEWRADGIKFTQLRRHGYKLAIDSGPNKAKINITDIHTLLTKHWSYQKSGNLNKADEIWLDLSDAGVFLDEASSEWRADGIKHNYRLSPGAGRNRSNLDEKVIHYLLEKRMIYRWRKDFTTSDQIRDRLKRDGVYIDDDKKEWRADGKRYDQLCHRYKQAADSGPLCTTISENDIHQLLLESWQAKLAQEYNKADRVSNELFNAGVYVNDKTEEWRGDGISCNYQLIPGAGPISENCPLDTKQIHRMLEESFRLRLHQDFDKANQIHDQLFHAGIFIDQDNNQWRGDGIMHRYNISPIAGPNTSLLEETNIHKLIADRWRYKVLQQFENADRIFVDIYDSGVYVDDEAMEWRADGIYHIYRYTNDAGPNVSTLSDDEIHKLLGKRMRYRKFKSFMKADQVLHYLKDAKIYVDDKKKEWRADGVTYTT